LVLHYVVFWGLQDVDKKCRSTPLFKEYIL
jgi:hypothetical protein